MKGSTLKFALLAAMLSAGVVPAFAAQTYTPGEVMAPSELETNGGIADIIGIRPGLRCAEAKELLVKAFDEENVKEQKINIGMPYKGVSVSTEFFVNELSARRTDDGQMQSLTVHCTGLASGNQVIALERSVSYDSPLGAPTVENATKSLIEKYGQASAVKHNEGALGFMEDYEMYWTYNQGNLTPCKMSSYESGACPSSLMDPYYRPEGITGFINDKGKTNVVVRAEVTGNTNDRTKTRSFEVMVIDFARRKAAAKVDFDSLRAEAARIHAESSKAGAMPKL